MYGTDDWFEIWQERGPLEDLFPVASTDRLAVLLDDWPFGCGRFKVFAYSPAAGVDGPRRPVVTLLHTGRMYTGECKWFEESRP